MTLVTVFGGTGFLGKQVVRSALAHNLQVRSVSRHGERAESFNVDQVTADIGDDRSVTAAVSGSSAVVNAVSLYVEKSNLSFNSVHIERTGIGVNLEDPSPWMVRVMRPCFLLAMAAPAAAGAPYPMPPPPAGPVW
jgi:uncharacterized protein YbjT (DUF2867 family)